MKLLNKVVYLCIFLVCALLVGCNLTSNKNQLSSSKPKDFNFVFNYGVGAKNQLDTIKGQYTKDMVTEPSITTDLKLSDEEMDIIYSKIREINVLDYPEIFKPKSNALRTPFSTYHIKIIADGRKKTIYWEDENVSESKEAVQLRNLFEKIQEIVISKEEFKKLPRAKGGYD